MPDLATCDYWIGFYSERKEKLMQAQTGTKNVHDDLAMLLSDVNSLKANINGIFGTQDWEGKQVQTALEIYGKGHTEMLAHKRNLTDRISDIAKGIRQAEDDITHWQTERAAEEARLAAAAAAAAAMAATAISR